ncbi:MAG: hypothetical protein PX635_00775 [Nostocales cyanobacterium LE14-WE12]|jgi:DNA transposition AAA+ family ATPase|nr:hypothetical protein [Nostocales cyanobacterium LE14-WE12]
MEKPITIEELNSINTVRNEEADNELRHKDAVSKCIREINSILKTKWHLRKKGEFVLVDTKHYWGYDAFNEAAKMFQENGIELSYYQPHRNLSIKV